MRTHAQRPGTHGCYVRGLGQACRRAPETGPWASCLFSLVAVIWVLASFLVQEVEAEGLSPFALTYIANSLFIIYLPVYFVTQ